MALEEIAANIITGMRNTTSDPLDLVSDLAAFISAASAEIDSKAFREMFWILMPLAVGLNCDSDTYEHAYRFKKDDSPNLYIMFKKLNELETAFTGKWGFVHDTGETPRFGTISFELERDYIEFKMRME